jgi:hypothetical protein
VHSWLPDTGYKLPAIIEELKALDADVLALQEVRLLLPIMM